MKRGLIISPYPAFASSSCRLVAEIYQVIKMSKVDEIKLKISSNKVVVYSKTYCPFCTKAKTALKDAGLKDYILIELDEMADCAAFQDALQELTGARSVPRVFIGGKFVGGGDDVKRLQDTGKLKPMLQEAGAL